MIEPQFNDIYGMFYVPWWESRFFYYVVWCIIASMIFFIGYQLWRWYRARIIVISVPDRCLRELINMQYMMSQNSLDYNIAYTTMSRLFRDYITYCYKVCSVHKTDVELKENIKNFPLPAELIEPLEKLFERAYRVKFAEVEVDSRVVALDITLFIDMITKTRNIIPSRTI